MPPENSRSGSMRGRAARTCCGQISICVPAGAVSMPPRSRRRGCARSGISANGEDTMARLITASRFADPDGAYVALVEARRGLSADAAAALDARLVLILANHIGDLDVLNEAIDLA